MFGCVLSLAARRRPAHLSKSDLRRARRKAILLFYSKGYFFSRPCEREIRFSLELDKPLVIVHEVKTVVGH